jgi:sugar-specific transcriptional regulator TrmB
MNSLDKGIQILNNLGLTTLQAKVYLTLSYNGKATIKTISKLANMDRANVYRTINTLQQLGLVQQIIGFPNIYEAIPLQSAIKILMEHKKQTEREIEEQIGYYLEENAIPQPTSAEDTESKFIMIPQKEAFIKKLRSELDNVQESAEIFATARCFPEIMEYFSKCNRSSDPKVKLRVLVEKSGSEKTVPKEPKLLLDNLKCEVRNTGTCPPVDILVFDSKKALVVIDPTLELGYSPALWTNHTGLVAIIQDYFEKLWSQAQTSKPITTIETSIAPEKIKQPKKIKQRTKKWIENYIYTA